MKSHIDGDTRIELKEKSETRVNPTSIQEGASRIAEQRRRAVEYFMNDDEKEEFLLFSDSDVFYGSNVLAEMTRDYAMLKNRKWSRICGLSAHALAGCEGHLQIVEQLFAQMRLTGDAHFLFHREIFERVGNPFSGEKLGGFMDTFYEATLKLGLRVYTRVSPPYEVHHAVGTSVIHTETNPKKPGDANVPELPAWVREPYKGNHTVSRRPLWLRGVHF